MRKHRQICGQHAYRLSGPRESLLPWAQRPLAGVMSAIRAIDQLAGRASSPAGGWIGESALAWVGELSVSPAGGWGALCSVN